MHMSYGVYIFREGNFIEDWEVRQNKEALSFLLTLVLLEPYIKSCFNPYSAGIDFSRQNLTSVDVRF